MEDSGCGFQVKLFKVRRGHLTRARNLYQMRLMSGTPPPQLGNIPAPPQSATSLTWMLWFRGKIRQLNRTCVARVVSPNETETALEIRGGRNSNVKRFRGGHVFKAHRLVYHSTLGLIVIKKKKDTPNAFLRRLAGGLISKHLQFINLVQGNLLHRTIFISNIKVNVK